MWSIPYHFWYNLPLFAIINSWWKFQVFSVGKKMNDFKQVFYFANAENYDVFYHKMIVY